MGTQSLSRLPEAIVTLRAARRRPADAVRPPSPATAPSVMRGPRPARAAVPQFVPNSASGGLAVDTAVGHRCPAASPPLALAGTDCPSTARAISA